MKKFMVNPKQANGFEQAQVCSGGVDFTELTTDMESIYQPGLFICGEMVDVDGKCGGYNLQWAWTSGYIAGVSAAK
jgi:predicted flavoprotein YhiN